MCSIRKTDSQTIRATGTSLPVVVCLVIIALIALQGRFFFARYRQSLLNTQQQELLTMAETVGHGLALCIEGELDGIDLYCSGLRALSGEDREPPARLIDVFLQEKAGLYDGMRIYDAEGTVLAEQGLLEYSSTPPAGQGQAEICGKTLCSGGWYQLFIAKEFPTDTGMGTALFALNLNRIYELVVQPVKIGKGGYSVVKDSDLAIIMHHAPSQIGMDAIYDRQEQYPQLDLSSLFQWLELQRREPAGTGLIESYKWDDPQLTPQRRIVAYTTVQLPGDEWIVNSTLPYDELALPLGRMMMQLILVGVILTGLILLITVIQVRNRHRAESQGNEIRYLRRINEGMHLLRRKEEELQHYQRIQSLGQMSSHIAHEFNNYLTPVILYGEMLEGDEDVSPENRELVRGILSSAEQASQLSRRLLDFSRQESAASLVELDLTEEIRSAVSIVRQLTPKKISFTARVMEEAFPVRGVKGVGNHILMNLCNNAYHAMEAEGGSLEVVYTADPKLLTDLPDQGRSGFAMLRVADTGCGIPAESLQKIFEPFYTTKRSGKGTGLGLSAVKNIITAMGGQIFVDSTPGEGTCFRMYFPRSAADPASVPVRKVRSLAMADDDPVILNALERLLKTPERKLFRYDHPAVLLSQLQKDPNSFDLILTDYSMPDMNGLELAELAHSLNPAIRVILMSGSWDEQFRWYLNNGVIEAFVLKNDLSRDLPEMLEGKE